MAFEGPTLRRDELRGRFGSARVAAAPAGKSGGPGAPEVPPTGDGGPGEPWDRRVRFSTDRNGSAYAFRPAEVLVRATQLKDAVSAIAAGQPNVPRVATLVGGFVLLIDVGDPIAVVEDLQRGFTPR